MTNDVFVLQLVLSCVKRMLSEVTALGEMPTGQEGLFDCDVAKKCKELPQSKASTKVGTKDSIPGSGVLVEGNYAVHVYLCNLCP